MRDNITKQIIRVGHEQEPIAIIDNFTSYFNEIIDGAKYAKYHQAAAGYPGIRAPLNAQYLSERSAILSQIVQEVFGFTKGIKCESCDYSIVTTLPENLAPAQRIPHYDTANNNILAFMHYAADHSGHSDDDKGGTAFYRHKATGFESISPQREPHYKAILKQEIAQMGEPKYEYIYGNSDRFEMIEQIESRPNRFILYRGRTLHSGCISKNANFSADPQKGRLTINGFLADSG